MAQVLYIVTYPAGTGTPSNAQIVAGQDSTGAAASWADNAVWIGSGQYLDASGLSASTEYDSAAVIFDGTTYSNVVEVSGTWTTLSDAITAALAKTLDAATIASASKLAIAGSLSKTLDAATVSSASKLAIAGALAKTLDAATSASTGALAIKAASSVTLGAVTLASAGSLTAVGSGALTQTLEAATLAAASKIAIAGALAATLANATLSAAGELAGLPGTGSVVKTLDSATVSSTAKLAIGASVSATLESLTSTSAAQIYITGSVGVTLGAATLSAYGGLPSAGVTLSPEDIAAIANAVWQHGSATNIAIQLAEAWGRLGLDPSKPLISGQTEISFGAIVMALAGNETASTLTRQ
jgi:hypothetical protein